MRFALRLVAICAFSLIVGTNSVRADEPGEEDSVRAFREVQPALVSLQNAEGSGSGIILDATGLILTNAHVVISPMPFKCLADSMDKPGQPRQVEFKKVQIVGYHPTLDLALVRVDPRETGAKLQPAVITRVKPSPGQHVFVIGNPAGGGMVLTKTITAGMLSAVDREVDGEKYFQIDAAINPGNSGGPLADRKGQVLGVVTFKFTDAQAIGFAIPIQDLKTNEFVSLSKKKGNPDRAKEFITLAQKFNNMAREATTGRMVAVRQPGFPGPVRYVRQPGNEKDRLIFASYAALCYRLALSFDPSNSVTWYNVATALHAIKEYEPAAAYMLRHIQLNPWGSPNGDAYRELGMSLASLKRNDDALIALNEGVAKFPYNGRIWYDIALVHKQMTVWGDAYYNVNIALSAGVAANVRSAASRLQLESKEKYTGGVDPRNSPEAILTKLQTSLSDSNKARLNRAVYLTEEFTKYALATDGPVPEGVKEKIPQEPLVAPPTPAVAAAPTEPAANPKHTAPVANLQNAPLPPSAALDRLKNGEFIKPPPSASPTNYLKAVSTRGDFIGQGHTFNYDTSNLSTTGSTKIINATIDGWTFHFAPPRGGNLAVGEYADAKRWPFNENSPGLDIIGHGRGSNRVAGKFVIWELEIQDGKVAKLAVDFIFHSETTMPPLYGMLRYHSSFE